MQQQRPNPTPSPPSSSLAAANEALDDCNDEAQRRRRTVEMMTKRYMTRFMGKHQTTTEIAEEIKSRVEKRIDESFDNYVQPDHPPYHLMIVNAIEKLNEEGGSTQETISEHIKNTFPSLPYVHERCLSQHLAKLGASGDLLVTDEQRYMLPIDNSIVVAKKEMKLKSSKQKRRHKQSQGKQKAKIQRENQTQERENSEKAIQRKNMIANSEKAIQRKNINVTEGEKSNEEAGNKELAEENIEADNQRFCINGDEQNCLEKTNTLKKVTESKEQMKVTRGQGQGRTKWQLPDGGIREQNGTDKDGEAENYVIQVDKTIKKKISGEGSEQNQVNQELDGILGNQNQACQVNISSDQHMDDTLVHHCRDPNCCYLEVQRLREEVAEWERRVTSCGLCKCSKDLKCLKEQMLEAKRQMQKLSSLVQKHDSLASSQGLVNGPLNSEDTRDDRDDGRLMQMDASKGDSVCPAVAECDGECQEGQGLQQIQEDSTIDKKSEQDNQIESGDTFGLKRLPDVEGTALKGRPHKRKKITELPGQPEDLISKPMSASHLIETERQIADARAVMSQQRRQLRPRAAPPKAGYSDALTETTLSVPQHQQKEMFVKQVRGCGRPPKKVDTNTIIDTQHLRRGRSRKLVQDSDKPTGELQQLSLVSADHEADHEAQPLLQIEYQEMQTSKAVESDAKYELVGTSKSQCKQKHPSARGRGRPPKSHL